jgi:endonuclease III
MMIKDLFVLLFSIYQSYVKLLTIQKLGISERIKKIGFFGNFKEKNLIYVLKWLPF